MGGLWFVNGEMDKERGTRNLKTHQMSLLYNHGTHKRPQYKIEIYAHQGPHNDFVSALPGAEFPKQIHAIIEHLNTYDRPIVGKLISESCAKFSSPEVEHHHDLRGWT